MNAVKKYPSKFKQQHKQSFLDTFRAVATEKSACSELVDSSAVLSGHEDLSSISPRILKKYIHLPISEIFAKEVVILSPEMRIKEALLYLNQLEVDTAIVQETSDTILGVISLEAINQFVSSAIQNRNEVIFSMVTRNVSIEPDDATLLEVIDRVLVGTSQFVIIVDSRGNPYQVLHEQSLYRYLKQLEV